MSVRRLEQRASELDFSPTNLSSVLVTHEHSDHIGGVAALARRYRIPVYMTHGTQTASSFRDERDVEIREISAHEPFPVGALTLRPAPVPHDAKEPCQFVVEHDEVRMGLLTDVGSETRHIEQHFADCDALILEFNHDIKMLSDCRYPDSVKQRIAGSHGHFNNQQAQNLLGKLLSRRLRYVFGAHISQHANSYHLVQKKLQDLLRGTDIKWDIAYQNCVTPWVTI